MERALIRDLDRWPNETNRRSGYCRTRCCWATGDVKARLGSRQLYSRSQNRGRSAQEIWRLCTCTFSRFHCDEPCCLCPLQEGRTRRGIEAREGCQLPRKRPGETLERA